MKRKLLSTIGMLMAICLCVAGCSRTKPPTDTVKWINTTYAVLTARNKGNLDVVGGFDKNKVSKEMALALLKESWEVTDRKSADESLEWLLTEGHRTPYLEEINEIKDSGIMTASKEDIQKAYGDSSNFTINMVEAYKKYGEKAIDAWDYCRAIQILGYFYVADLYTEEETLDRSLEIAKILQQSYSSWEELVESYMYGFQYWQEDDATNQESETYKRRQVYEKLKSSDKNPYSIEWNIELIKTW